MVTYTLIGRGKAGWHAEGFDSQRNRVSSMSYDMRDQGIEQYLECASEGAYVYDAKDADESAFTSWVVRGSMPNALLPESTYEKAFTHERGVYAGERTFEGLRAFGLKSLDYVSVDVFVDALKSSVPGVCVGRVYNGRVEWER